MSLTMYSFSIDNDRYHRNGGQYYPIGFSPEEVWAFDYPTYDYCRSPKQQLLNGLRETGSKIKSDKNKFQVNVDVKRFTLNELSVKTVDGYVIVKAKHGDKMDSQGWVSRQFTRKFQLPEGCNAESVQCHLSCDGILMVTVPRDRNMKSNERVVPIIETGTFKRRSETKVDRAEEVEKQDGADEDASEKTLVEDVE